MKVSENWTEVLKLEKQFRTKIARYHIDTSPETIKNDLLASLDSRDGQLITTRLMSEGYIQEKAIVSIWEELVSLVFYGTDEVAAWSIDALSRLSREHKDIYRNEITMLVFRYAKAEMKDDLAVTFGMQLLYRLSYREELIKYIDSFKSYMDLQEDDFASYINDCY